MKEKEYHELIHNWRDVARRAIEATKLRFPLGGEVRVLVDDGFSFRAEVEHYVSDDPGCVAIRAYGELICVTVERLRPIV